MASPFPSEWGYASWGSQSERSFTSTSTPRSNVSFGAGGRPGSKLLQSKHKQHDDRRLEKSVKSFHYGQVSYEETVEAMDYSFETEFSLGGATATESLGRATATAFHDPYIPHRTDVSSIPHVGRTPVMREPAQREVGTPRFDMSFPSVATPTTPFSLGNRTPYTPGAASTPHFRSSPYDRAAVTPAAPAAPVALTLPTRRVDALLNNLTTTSTAPEPVAPMDVDPSYHSYKNLDEMKAYLASVDHDNERFAREVEARVKAEEEAKAGDDAAYEEMLAPLSGASEEQVRKLLGPGNMAEIISPEYNLDITREQLHSLIGLEWLNDQVVNFMCKLMQEENTATLARQIADGVPPEQRVPDCHFFGTFHFPKIAGEAYSRQMGRWTKTVDLFKKDLIIVPVHLGVHWTLAVVNMRDKKLTFYDSMAGKGGGCLRVLKGYLNDEHKEKKGGVEFPTGDWPEEYPTGIPMQKNGSDCGVFMLKFADYLSRGLEFRFDQRNMPYFRKRMAIQIYKKSLAAGP